ncbi:hypothetical protein MTP09_04030 [Chryseobacterium suipulveris]|uniref:Uncharacterized protein n=1 Tax=Chryseobacterium suipulveris TaxID=2929800 RepID=A0ABY4BRI4_9FLAO|nr:hypothetical protein [Chryseobacterium suipulveris]UOE41811.1 hypothetical protein MTP09_04030 [Chryseobacterium suipulveris]
MILSRLQELSEFLRFAVFNEISVFENQVSIHKTFSTKSSARFTSRL